MTSTLLSTLFLPLPVVPKGDSPSATVQLVLALILAIWLMQLVRLAFLVVQVRRRVPRLAGAGEALRTEIEVGHAPALGEL